MQNKRARYKKMELLITIALCLNTAVFLAFLIVSGLGLTAYKVITAIVCIGISGGVLYQLFTTRELLRRRSLWMTLAAACIIICVLFSLILKFPAPKFTLPTV